MNEWLFKHSARLFARPSFLEGFCRILDLGSTLNIYNCDRNEIETDMKALFSDWLTVGDAIQDSIDKFNSSPPPQREFEFVEK